MERGEAILALGNLSKTFAGTRALDSVDLDVLSGEVHGLLGQNGSGKSTLIKVLSGVYEPDDGATMTIRGGRVDLPLAPGESRKRGIGFVHQDLALVPSLSILENLRTDGFRTGFAGHIKWKEERARAREALGNVGLDVDPTLPVSALSAAERAMVALARSLDEIRHVERGLLVLDEPTAYLPRFDVESLFGAVREVTARGCGVLFVSHRLDEVLAICDRVTILRDGRKIGTTEVAGSSEEKLMTMIVGRELGQLEERVPASGEEAVLRVRDLSGAVARDVSFDLNRGEIVGLTGLLGMGHDEVPYLLTGSLPGQGEIRLHGERIVPTPRSAARQGMVLLPASRAEQSGIGAATLRENVSLPVLGTYFGRGWLDQKRESSDVQALVDRFGVRPAQPERTFSTFSGGNQQKALLAKWLQTMPEVLVLHEPTHGVDVGAKTEVIKQIRDAAAKGVSVVLVSSEAEDLVKLCDRVHVFVDGEIVSTLTDGEITEARIVERCYATKSAA